MSPEKPPPPGVLRLVPLGGLGEIGMNCLCLEQHDGILVVDCGTAFPQDDLGVDVLHPDFAWLLARREHVRGVFLTHGHEDHIGALPYLLGELEVPVWGPAHALALVERRLEEHGFRAGEVSLRPVGARDAQAVGGFEVEPIRVAHSIAQATALAVRTTAGLVLHTGDFNLDPDPPDGEPTDVDRLAALGDEGVSLLLSDSTNIDVPEPSGSERAVGRTLDTLVGEATGRVVLGMFASNVQRLALVGELAQRHQRKLCLLGRSVGTHAEVARRLGLVRWPSDLLVGPDQARELPRSRLLAVAGGTQGERGSALRRLAQGEHPDLELAEGDTVILSSRVIPGHERVVWDMGCDLLRRGVTLHTRVTHPGVHTSGHASRAEQRRMIELTQPLSFAPVHGTLHHLRRHGELARELGVPSVGVVESGRTLVLDGNGIAPGDRHPFGRVPVAQGGERLAAEVLRRRADLGRGGVVVVSLCARRRRLVGPARITALGVPGVDENDAVLRAAALEAARAAERSLARDGRVEEDVRRAVRRVVHEASGTRGTIEVQLLEAD